MNCLHIKLMASDGQEYSLSDFAGKKVVLYFYPKDNTSGCTTEAMDFSQYKANFEKLDTIIVGVSRDTVKSHQNFIVKKELSILLLSDPQEELCSCFDVMKEKTMYGKKHWGVERSTFLLGEQGEVIKEWRKVKVKNHVSEVYEFVSKL